MTGLVKAPEIEVVTKGCEAAGDDLTKTFLGLQPAYKAVGTPKAVSLVQGGKFAGCSYQGTFQDASGQNTQVNAKVTIGDGQKGEAKFGWSELSPGDASKATIRAQTMATVKVENGEVTNQVTGVTVKQHANDKGSKVELTDLSADSKALLETIHGAVKTFATDAGLRFEAKAPEVKGVMKIGPTK